MIAQRTIDEDVRVRWFRGPLGSEMAALAGPIERTLATPDEDGADERLDDDDAAAAELGAGQDERRDRRRARDRRAGAVARRLGELYATIGASSRADATAFAFRERVL